jgi:hypothetical protein
VFVGTIDSRDSHGFHKHIEGQFMMPDAISQTRAVSG